MKRLAPFLLYVIAFAMSVRLIHGSFGERDIGTQSLTKVEDLQATGFATVNGTVTLGDATHDTTTGRDLTVGRNELVQGTFGATGTCTLGDATHDTTTGRDLTIGRNLTATAGNTLLGGTGTTRVSGGAGIVIDTAPPTLALPRLMSFVGNPNGVAITSSPAGSILMDTSTPSLWQNTNGATAWSAIGTGTVTSVACGTGMSCAPSPIVATGTVSLNITPTNCPGGQAEISTASNGTSTCAAFGSSSLTNSAGANVITKSNGTNIVAANIDDDGTTLSIPHGGSAIQCTEATGVCTWTGGQTFNGNVGLGVTPAVQFDQVEVNVGDHQITRYGSQSAVTLRRANGTSGSPTGLVSGSLLGLIRVSGYTSAGAFSGGYSMVTAAPDETWTSTANGFATRISAVRDGTLTNLDVITAVGGTATSGSLVGIGTTAPTHRLSIGLPGTGQIPVPSACGSAPAPALSAGAADLKGGVTVGGGAATSCTLTFGTAFSTYENCMVTSATGTIPISYTQSLTAIVVTSAATMSGDRLDWDCMGSL